MPLTKRIIPCLDINNNKVSKGLNFSSLKEIGDPVLLAKKYNDEGADEIIFLDITASNDKHKTLKTLISKTANVIHIPFTVGGGISTLHNARDILLSGADKVTLNTAAIQNPKLVHDLMEMFGKQCIVVAIDVKRNYNIQNNAKNIFVDIYDQKFWFEVFIYGGKTKTNIDAIEWANHVQHLGAGEILLTSIDMDGTKNGYDIQLTKTIVDTVKIPIIASGGCGNPKHMLDVIKQSDVSGVLAASIFHYNIYSIMQVKNYLKNNRINVRL